MHNKSIENPNGIKPKSYRWKKFTWCGAGTIAIALLLLASCVRIPEGSGLISHRDTAPAMSPGKTCKPPPTPRIETSNEPKADGLHRDTRQAGLHAGGFTLVNWNVFKGKKEGWPQDFTTLLQSSDIVTLQEAHLTDHLKEMLDREDFAWDMAGAFEYKKNSTGVLTAARTVPSQACALKDKEPIVRLPKSILVSNYPFSGTPTELMVANIHGINFSLGLKSFKKQLDRMETILSEHDGPVIVSGDFNTWSAVRLSLVNAMAERLGLSAVQFENNHRTRFFGYDVDHIYFRGLRTENARIPIVSTSDHNPLTVTFMLESHHEEN